MQFEFQFDEMSFKWMQKYWKFACNYDVEKIILRRHFFIAFYLRMAK
jgi:hypothetical protein